VKLQREFVLFLSVTILFTFLIGCQSTQEEEKSVPQAQYFLKRNQTHNKFSNTIPPVLSVPSGAVIEAETEEASDEQLSPTSTVEDVRTLSFDPIHPLTGPVYVDGAEPGDVLAVTLHLIEPGDWGWITIIPDFGFLADEFSDPYIKVFSLGKNATETRFNEKITIPLKPFPGVMGVAPDTDELLVTGPPRANGGNMDNPYLTEGMTVYFPVFVEGALFSIGDVHAAQGMGEVCGAAIEMPARIIYQVEVIKGKKYIKEPQFESDEIYGTSAVGTTLIEASRKALRFMIDYLEAEHGMSRTDAYVLCSIAGDLNIAEVVDMPNYHVTMHMSKEVLGIR